MARIPYADPADLSEETRRMLEKAPAKLNVFRMMAHAEANYRPFMVMGNSILKEQKLDARLRELIILRVARLCESQYEWIQHVAIGRSVGVADAQIKALESDDPAAPCFSETERLVLRAVDEVVRTPRLTDGTLAAMAKVFSSREVVEILIAAGFYMMLARVLESTGVDLDAPVEGFLQKFSAKP